MRLFSQIMRNRPIEGREMLEKRRRFSKVFDMGNGQRKMIVTQVPLHFKNAAGEFEDIDLTPRKEGEYWIVDRAPYILKVSEDYPFFEYQGRGSQEHAKGSCEGFSPIEVGDSVFTWKLGKNVNALVVVLPNAVRVGLEVLGPEADFANDWTINGASVAYTQAMDAQGNPGEIENGRFTGRVSKLVDAATRQRKWSLEAAWPVRVF